MHSVGATSLRAGTLKLLQAKEYSLNPRKIMNPQNLKRKRGVILTPQGLSKLQSAKHYAEDLENFGSKYTLEKLSERSRLAPFTVAKILASEQGVDKQTLDRFFRAFDLDLTTSDYCRPNSNFEEQQGATFNPRCYWGEAVDVSIFYGRAEELATLEQWLVKDRCRLVALLGMGGIGKTALAVKLAEQIQDQFEYLIWRSLRNAPTIEDILAELIQFLSDDQGNDLPETVDGRVSQLMEYLRKYRCLLVLDNAESILRSCDRAGHYRLGYEGYGELLRRVGEERHQSCLVLTSREKPKEIASLEGKTLPIRSFPVAGLKEAEGQEVLKAKGFSGAEDESRDLIHCYAGNPLALKIVATSIQDLFDGNVAEFLSQKTAVFGDIRELLDQQFERLSALEKQVMYWLAINREPVPYLDMQNDLPPVSKSKLLETLESLERRSLIEQSAASFTQQPVVIEYVTEKLIEQISEEDTAAEIALLIDYAIRKAQQKDYVKESKLKVFLNCVVNSIQNNLKTNSNIGYRMNTILLKIKEKVLAYQDMQVEILLTEQVNSKVS